MSIHISFVSQTQWHAWSKWSHPATPFHSVCFLSKYFWHASCDVCSATVTVGLFCLAFGKGFSTWSCLLQDAKTSPVPVLYKEIKKKKKRLWNHFFCGLFWSDYLNTCEKVILSYLTNWQHTGGMIQSQKVFIYTKLSGMAFVNTHTFYL